MDEDSGVDYAGRAKDILGFSRWWQIAAAAGMMAAVSPYQYVWSSIEGPLAENLDIALPALGAVFSFYVVFHSPSQMPARAAASFVKLCGPRLSRPQPAGFCACDSKPT